MRINGNLNLIGKGTMLNMAKQNGSRKHHGCRQCMSKEGYLRWCFSLRLRNFGSDMHSIVFANLEVNSIQETLKPSSDIWPKGWFGLLIHKSSVPFV